MGWEGVCVLPTPAHLCPGSSDTDLAEQQEIRQESEVFVLSLGEILFFIHFCSLAPCSNFCKDWVFPKCFILKSLQLCSHHCLSSVMLLSPSFPFEDLHGLIVVLLFVKITSAKSLLPCRFQRLEHEHIWEAVILLGTCHIP